MVYYVYFFQPGFSVFLMSQLVDIKACICCNNNYINCHQINPERFTTTLDLVIQKKHEMARPCLKNTSSKIAHFPLWLNYQMVCPCMSHVIPMKKSPYPRNCVPSRRGDRIQWRWMTPVGMIWSAACGMGFEPTVHGSLKGENHRWGLYKPNNLWW